MTFKQRYSMLRALKKQTLFFSYWNKIIYAIFCVITNLDAFSTDDLRSYLFAFVSSYVLSLFYQSAFNIRVYLNYIKNYLLSN